MAKKQAPRDKKPYDMAVRFDTLTDVIDELADIVQISANNPIEDHVTFEMPDGLPVLGWVLQRRGDKFVVVISDAE